MSRVALISGGTSGIGAAIARALQAAGYKVAVNYAFTTDRAAAFQKETGIPAFQWDVRDYDACLAGIAQVEATFGPIEVLVNNAGITRDAMFHKMSPQQWREVIDTNLTGVFNMTHPVWPGMRERGLDVSSTYPRSTVRRGRRGRRTTPPPRPEISALPKPSPRKARAAISRSTRYAPDISARRWSEPFPNKSCQSASYRRSRWDGLANPKRSPVVFYSLSPTRRDLSPAPPLRPTADNISPDKHWRTSGQQDPDLSKLFVIMPRRRRCRTKT